MIDKVKFTKNGLVSLYLSFFVDLEEFLIDKMAEFKKGSKDTN